MHHQLRAVEKGTEMRRMFSRALILGAVAALPATPTLAQDYSWSAGWNAGVLYGTSLNSGSGEFDVDLAPEATWSVGLHVDRWAANGRVGLRLHGALSEHSVSWTQGDRGISVYGLDVSLLLRPVAPTPDNSVSVYLSAGAGVTRWGFGNGPTTTFPSAGAAYSGREATDLVGMAGLGLDIQTGLKWGEGPLVLRIEGRDEVQRSPLDPVDPSGDSFAIVHNVRVSIGLHTGGGVLRGRR